ncbi:nucleoside-diphosphate kinase [Pseudomonas putida]
MLGMQLALCYLKPDLIIMGRVAKALEVLRGRGFQVHGFHILDMNEMLYRLAYEEGFDACRDAWQINYRFAGIGPWIALLLAGPRDEDPQAYLKQQQGPAIPVANGQSIRTELGHLNRLLNCLHVPDDQSDALRQISLLFPDCRFHQDMHVTPPGLIIDELQRHHYEPRRCTGSQFRKTLWQRIAHRASRVDVDALRDFDLSCFPLSDTAMLNGALKTLDLSISERTLLHAVLLDADIGSNRLLKTLNVEIALKRNFIHLSEWDHALLFGFFGYPTL